MKRQAGFTLVEGIFIVIILAVVGTVGYLAYTHLYLQKTAQNSAVIPAAAASPTPVVVQKKADLDTAATALGNIPLDDSDSGQLDSAANSF